MNPKLRLACCFSSNRSYFFCSVTWISANNFSGVDRKAHAANAFVSMIVVGVEAVDA